MHDPPLFLGRLGKLLGLPANTTINVNTKTVPPGKVYRDKPRTSLRRGELRYSRSEQRC